MRGTGPRAVRLPPSGRAPSPRRRTRPRGRGRAAPRRAPGGRARSRRAGARPRARTITAAQSSSGTPRAPVRRRRRAQGVEGGGPEHALEHRRRAPPAPRGRASRSPRRRWPAAGPGSGGGPAARATAIARGRAVQRASCSRRQVKSASSTCGTRAATAGRGRALSRRGPRATSATRSPSLAAMPEIQRSIASRRSSLSQAGSSRHRAAKRARAAELAGERLLQREAVGGAEERPHDLGDEGAVEGVARVGGRDEVGVAGERRPREGRDRLRGDARDLGVEDDDRPRLEEVGRGEDGAQRGRLPGHAVVRAR